jgi:hypothetical protein
MSDKIMIRVSDEQKEELLKKAGDTPLATYIKDALFKSEVSPTSVSSASEAEWLEFGEMCDIDKVLDLLAMKTGKRAPTKGYMNHWVIYFMMLLTGGTRDTKDDPSAWTIVPNPDGEKKPWTNEDNQRILVITDGKNTKTLTDGDEWFNHFV